MSRALIKISNAELSPNTSEVIELISSDSKLIKRPFLFIEDDCFLVGFKEEKWVEKLL